MLQQEGLLWWIKMKNKKNIIILVLMIFCVGFIGVGAYLLKNNKEKWPKDDIYVYDSNGYLAYEEDEKVYVGLLLCSLHRNGKNPIEQYSGIFLLDEVGNKYSLDIDEGIKESLCNDEEIISESIVNFEIGSRFKAGEIINFNTLLLEKSDGTEKSYDFGTITVEIIEKSDEIEKLNIQSESIYAMNFKRYTFKVRNDLEENIAIKEMVLGDNVELGEVEQTIESKKTKSIEVNILNKENFGNTPEFYIVKPKIKLLVGNSKEIVCAVDGSMSYSRSTDNKTLRNYLLEREKKGN